MFIILPVLCVFFLNGSFLPLSDSTHLEAPKFIGLPPLGQDAATLEAKRQRMARQIERRRQALALWREVCLLNGIQDDEHPTIVLNGGLHG